MVWVVWLSLQRAKKQARPIRFENDGRFESSLEALHVHSSNTTYTTACAVLYRYNLCCSAYVVSRLSAEAESELMRMERVFNETSKRISQLQQQLSDQQLGWSDDEQEEEEEEEQPVSICPLSTIVTV